MSTVIQTVGNTAAENFSDHDSAFDMRALSDATAVLSDGVADAFDMSLKIDHLPGRTDDVVPEVDSSWSPQELELSEGEASLAPTQETVVQTKLPLPEAKPRLKPGRPLLRSSRPNSVYLLSQYDPDSDSDDNQPGTLSLKHKAKGGNGPNETFNATMEDSFPPKPPASELAKLHDLDPNAQLERLQQLENENFQLKLKVTVLQRHVHMKDSTRDLYSMLADSQVAQEQQKAEIKSLEAQLQAANEMRNRSSELEFDGKHSSDISGSDKDEMIAALSNAQEFYEQVIQGMLNAALAEGERPPDTLEDQLIFIEKSYLNALKVAKETRQKFELLTKQFEDLVDHEHQDRDRKESAEQILDAIADLFDCKGTVVKLPDIVADLLSNNKALERQLITHCRRTEDMEAEIEHLHQQSRRNISINSSTSTLEDEDTEVGHENKKIDNLRQLRIQNMELSEANQQLTDSIARVSARNYSIMREFFQRMTENFGYEWGQENKLRLRAIVDEARRTQQSKLPMLVDLMLEIVDELSQKIHEAEQFPAIVTEYKQRIKSLESLLTHELVRAGADPVLLARYKDLQLKLKLEEERRKNEYIGYQRSLKNLRDSA